MNGEADNAIGRALERARKGFDEFTDRPGAFQLAGVAAVVLILGALLPWLNYGGEFGGDQYALGVETTVGELTLVAGVIAIVALSRLARGGADRDSGLVAALGLLAVFLVGAELIHINDNNSDDLGWGIWVSGTAAGLLLLAGIALFGARRTD